MIKTPRLLLQPRTNAHLTALIAGDAHFETQFGMRVMDGYLEFPEALQFMVEEVEHDPRWGTYLFIHSIDQVLMGMGGFKGSPNGDGMVEIGYGVANAYRNQGYATEAAAGLIHCAFQDADVQKVWAHTLPEANASSHVLKKCGMTMIGEQHDDPNGGRLWRWQVLRSKSISMI